MNIKKIILEEIDGFEWINDIKEIITLKPDTFYGFEPSLKQHELNSLIYRIPQYPNIIKWIGTISSRYDLEENGINYIVVNRPMEEGVSSWCNEASIDEARSWHPRHNYVNGREVFGI